MNFVNTNNQYIYQKSDIFRIIFNTVAKFAQNDSIESICKEEVNNEKQIILNSYNNILSVAKELYSIGFEQLIDICGVDFPKNNPRFHVIYNFLSLRYNIRFRVKIMVNDQEFIPSLTSIYKSSGWYEREIWDMFGIGFKNHPDLRRILTEYDFEGHPLRKDFPLSGYTEVVYDNEKEKIIHREITLQKEYRDYDFSNSWKGTKYL
ncbi:complex I 30 kDa subunit family protein [Lyticum sinuosum]|uniref:NADH-quinone oxidoreductase subunit C n=1 Tax=Lyticum sinuosum TaxID=1332059 RepID=A0AAE5AHN1_9RICK|nr:NADH-quinone oxidoreductase subunit C [Lyticum sinuosum]MDZ5761221.1 NADH-quinone oxidoreductase subunit C [Lyticum sinuosum]